MTVTQQREKIIIGLSKVEQKVDDLCVLITKQNSRIGKNEEKIQKQAVDFSTMRGFDSGTEAVSLRWDRAWKVIMSVAMIVLAGVEVAQRWGSW